MKKLIKSIKKMFHKHEWVTEKYIEKIGHPWGGVCVKCKICGKYKIAWFTKLENRVLYEALDEIINPKINRIKL